MPLRITHVEHKLMENQPFIDVCRLHKVYRTVGEDVLVTAMERTAARPLYQAAIGPLALVHLRTMLFKLGERTQTV